MAIYYYIQIVPKGKRYTGPASEGTIVVYGHIYPYEEHFGKSCNDIVNYYHPCHLKPEDRDWIIERFGKNNKIKLDVFVAPYFRSKDHRSRQENMLLINIAFFNYSIEKFWAKISGINAEAISSEISSVFEPDRSLAHLDKMLQLDSIPNDINGGKIVNEIANGIIGKEVDLDFDSFDYYLIQDNA